MSRVLPLLVALAVVPAAIQGQQCVGQAPWSAGPVKVGGGLEFGDGYRDIFGGIGFGKDHSVFAGGAIGVTDYTGPGSQVFISGGVGTELNLSAPVSICPVATAFISLPDNDVSGQTILAGLAGGYPVPTNNANLGVVVTGSLQVGFDRVSAGTFSDTEFAGLLDGGVGLIFNNRISLIPSIRVYFGSGDSNFAFLIPVNFSLGKTGSQ